MDKISDECLLQLSHPSWVPFTLSPFKHTRGHFVSNKPFYHSILDLDPCTNATCNYYSHCLASSPNQFTCVCENSCPLYEEQVCASNGRTFTNLCLLRREICRTSGNYTDYHPGSCAGILIRLQFWYIL